MGPGGARLTFVVTVTRMVAVPVFSASEVTTVSLPETSSTTSTATSIASASWACPRLWRPP